MAEFMLQYNGLLNTVDWASGRASGLKNTSDEKLVFSKAQMHMVQLTTLSPHHLSLCYKNPEWFPFQVPYYTGRSKKETNKLVLKT